MSTRHLFSLGFLFYFSFSKISSALTPLANNFLTPGKGKLNIAFKWDDSIILDRLTEMAQWQQEVSMGLRSKAEYRMHFFGEDEETATQAVQSIQQEAGAADILKGVLDNGDG